MGEWLADAGPSQLEHVGERAGGESPGRACAVYSPRLY